LDGIGGGDVGSAFAAIGADMNASVAQPAKSVLKGVCDDIVMDLPLLKERKGFARGPESTVQTLNRQ
jgi:hypothetical protein